MTGAAIVFDRVFKEYPLPNSSARVRALDDVAFSIPDGSTVAVMGPNGSGKTTLLLSILGLVRPSRGCVSVLGENAGNPLPRRKIGFAGGHGGLPDHLSGEEGLIWWGRVNGASRASAQSRSLKLLDRVGLSAAGTRRRRDYSRGMKQRLAWAQAIMFRPQLVILDEPHAGIDPFGMDTLEDIVRELQKSGATVVFSSHQMQPVEAFCDRVVMLDKGRVLLEGQVAKLTGDGKGSATSLDQVYREKWMATRDGK